LVRREGFEAKKSVRRGQKNLETDKEVSVECRKLTKLKERGSKRARLGRAKHRRYFVLLRQKRRMAEGMRIRREKMERQKKVPNKKKDFKRLGAPLSEKEGRVLKDPVSKSIMVKKNHTRHLQRRFLRDSKRGGGGTGQKRREGEKGVNIKTVERIQVYKKQP